MSARTTGISTDMAYCMLGIFGVSIDLRYGEEEDAFLRLQEQVVQKFKLQDQSVFAWDYPTAISHKLPEFESYGVLAPWPSCFRNTGNLTVKSKKLDKPQVRCRSEGQGIEFQVPTSITREDKITSYELGLSC